MIFHSLLFGFLFSAGIGPVNIETAKRGLTESFGSALGFFLGNAVIDALYILCVLFGFSLVVDNLILKILLGVFGVAYLVYLGVNNIRDAFKQGVFISDPKSDKSCMVREGLDAGERTSLRSVRAHHDSAKKKVLNPFLSGILVNLANPMAIASWIAFYGVVPEEYKKNLLVLFVSVVSGAILFGATISLTTHFSKRWVGEKIMRGISLLAGVLLLGFAGIFAFHLFVS